MSEPFSHQSYLLRRKVFTFLGAKFHVFDPDGEVVLVIKQKAFKLKEDIRAFADEAMTEERLVIRARQAIDFSAAYDVIDSETGTKVGALRRKGFRSMLRDSWEFLDEVDRPIAKLEEDSMLKAMVRRFLTNLVPQKFHLKCGDREVVTYRQFFNPFVLKYQVDVHDPEAVEPRLALAGAILLAAIEGRQR